MFPVPLRIRYIENLHSQLLQSNMCRISNFRPGWDIDRLFGSTNQKTTIEFNFESAAWHYALVWRYSTLLAVFVVAKESSWSFFGCWLLGCARNTVYCFQIITEVQ